MPKWVLFYEIIEIFSAILNKTLILLTFGKKTKYFSIRKGEVHERKIKGLSVIYYNSISHTLRFLLRRRIKSIQLIL